MDVVRIPKDNIGLNLPIGKYNPFDRFRPLQRETIEWLIEGIRSYENVILSAPPGTGKSLNYYIATMYLIDKGTFRGAYYVCHRKKLQEQLSDMFGLPVLMGRSNYSCLVEVCNDCPMAMGCDGYRPCTADNAPCVIFRDEGEGFGCDRLCEYRLARHKALGSPIPVIGSKYMLLDKMYLNSIVKRDLIVFDEAHTLELDIMDLIGWSLTSKKLGEVFNNGMLKRYKRKKISSTLWGTNRVDEPMFKSDKIPEVEDEKEWLAYLHELMMISREKESIAWDIMRVTNRLLGREDKEIVKSYRAVKTITEYCNRLYTELSNEPNNWAIVPNKDKVDFKPIRVDSHAPDLINKIADHRVFSSATIIDGEQLINDLGLNPDKSLWLRVDKSPFPKENRPLYIHPVGDLSRRRIDTDLPKVIAETQRIVDSHPNERILILPYTISIENAMYNGLNTPRSIDTLPYRRSVMKFIKGNQFGGWAYQVIDDAMNQLSKSRVVVGPHNYRQLEIVIKCYEVIPNSVLITTYLREGYDGRDERCRLIIIPKVPFPNIGDEVIKRRMKLNPKWYTIKTVNTLVQMIGRAVRSPTDYAEVYILDSQFKKLYNRAKQLFPDAVKEAIHWKK